MLSVEKNAYNRCCVTGWRASFMHRVDGIAFLLYSFLIDLRAEEMIETAKGKMESYHELYCV